jgi:hypothetical protein
MVGLHGSGPPGGPPEAKIPVRWINYLKFESLLFFFSSSNVFSLLVASQNF